MAKGLPMIVISPIIGQETRNSDFLTSQGAAIRIDSIDGLKAVLEDLASHPERLKAMRDAIARISKPRACYDVAKLALEL
jgi:processive 1,2-diacylglycerol beta-glucosyltransferase